MDKTTRNEDMILRFDPINASAEQVRHWLFAIIDRELEKEADKIDHELIQLCSDCEADLEDVADTISEAEYIAIIAEIKEKVDTTDKTGAKILLPKVKKYRSLKILASVAAVLITMILSLTVVAAVQGYTVIEFITENLKKIVNMDPGDELETNDVTVIRNGELIQYSSVEEAMKECNYSILYPSFLPDNIKINQIVEIHKENVNECTISIYTTSNTLTISARNHSLTSLDDLSLGEIYHTENLDFYIFDLEESYQAVCQYDGFEYRIIYDNYDELINIINNLRGTE